MWIRSQDKTKLEYAHSIKVDTFLDALYGIYVNGVISFAFGVFEEKETAIKVIDEIVNQMEECVEEIRMYSDNEKFISKVIYQIPEDKEDANEK